MAQDDEDGVQDQGSLDEPQKSTKSKKKDVEEAEATFNRVHDVPLKPGEPVDAEAMNRVDKKSKKGED